jgi:hypothetical protein
VKPNLKFLTMERASPEQHEAMPRAPCGGNGMGPLNQFAKLRKEYIGEERIQMIAAPEID